MSGGAGRPERAAGSRVQRSSQEDPGEGLSGGGGGRAGVRSVLHTGCSSLFPGSPGPKWSLIPYSVSGVSLYMALSLTGLTVWIFRGQSAREAGLLGRRPQAEVSRPPASVQEVTSCSCERLTQPLPFTFPCLVVTPLGEALPKGRVPREYPQDGNCPPLPRPRTPSPCRAVECTRRFLGHCSLRMP